MPVLGMIFGFAFVSVVLGGANYYVAKRMHQCLVYMFPNINTAVYIGIVVFLALVMILGFMRSMIPFSATVKNIIGGASMYWMGIFVYFVVFFALSDVVLFVCKLTNILPKPTPGNIRFYVGIVVTLITIVTVSYGIYNAKQIHRVSYSVELNQRELKGQLNMVVISDLHLGALGSEDRMSKIVTEINKINPDLVCISGDTFDNDYYAINNPEKVSEQFKNIKSKYGIFACLGNHDAGSTVDELVKFLERSNVSVLNDESVVIDNRFVLAGRLDETPIGGYGGLKRAETADVLGKTDGSLPVIVMEHNPAHIDEYEDKVDLIVSGHTHKGQLFPFNIITNLMYTVDYGHYRKDDNSPHVVVTSGVGTWGMPMRVGSHNEIVVVTLD